MTEIENIKAKIARFPSQVITFTTDEILPLLTTIESQKEEKAQLEESIRYLISTTDNEMEDVAYHKVLELMYPLVNRQGEDSRNSQIESLKAITELKNAEIERLVKFLTDLRNMTPYAMYIEMIDGVLCAK